VSPTVIGNKILLDGRDHSGDVGVDGRMQASCETVNCTELVQYRVCYCAFVSGVINLLGTMKKESLNQPSCVVSSKIIALRTSNHSGQWSCLTPL
jgi:hypothetical protein